MKKVLVNTLTTTCAALILLLIIQTIIQGKSFLDLLDIRSTISVPFFLQLLGLNFMINLGLYFTYKFESKYAILEILLDMGLTVAVLLIYGAIFDQLTGQRWLFVVMAIAIYSFMFFMNAARNRDDVNKINESIQKRKKERSESSTFIAS
ncbi:MAG: DUF3021 family protein [Treponema sp.]|nr:DUF3021 family protein [Treponema sp.]